MRELANQLWSTLAPAQEFILAVLVSVVIAFVLWLFRARVSLIWGRTSLNYHHFPLDSVDEAGHASKNDRGIAIATQKFFVQNNGRKAASGVEVVLSVKPTSYNLYPPRDHTSDEIASGEFSIKIPSLAPRELLVIDLIDLDISGPHIVAVNCPDVMSKQINFIAQRQFPRAVTWLVGYLMAAGLVGTAFIALQYLLGD